MPTSSGSAGAITMHRHVDSERHGKRADKCALRPTPVFNRFEPRRLGGGGGGVGGWVVGWRRRGGEEE